MLGKRVDFLIDGDSTVSRYPDELLKKVANIYNAVIASATKPVVVSWSETLRQLLWLQNCRKRLQ